MIKCSPSALRNVGEKTIRIATEEKLGAHALSVRLRMEEEKI